ncbi:MAG: hypothetical protein IT406_00185 [Candidatus Yanofskybacteria bacterium]|nr:hypothetical protein [Candidatus Yanofskybacteria bacterium]
MVGLGALALLGGCLIVLLARAVMAPRAFVKSLSLKRFVGTLLDSGVAAGAILLSAVLAWMLFGVHPHRLAMSHGDRGSYGVISDDRFMAEGVAVKRFTAVYVPSRIISVVGIPWPVPESLEVEVVYQGRGGAEETWEHTFLLACDEESACVPVYRLTGVQLCAERDEGRSTPACGPFVYLGNKGWPMVLPRPPVRAPLPDLVPSPGPVPNPSPTPTPPVKRENNLFRVAPGAIIALAPPVHKAGRFSALPW